MRFLFSLVLGVGLLAAFTGQAQKTSVVESVKSTAGIVNTAAGKDLVFNNYHDYGLNFSLSFPQTDLVATERAGMYVVHGQPLQVLVVPAASFRTDSAATTLQRYIANEAAYFRQEMKLDIEPFARVGEDKSGFFCAIWGFPMPAGTNEQIAQQLFVVFLRDDYIVSVGSVQMQGQDISAPLELLLATARTYKASATPISLKRRR